MKEPEKKENIYQLTCTEGQLRLINDAIEGYFRLLLGQYFDYADEIAFAGFDYENHSEDDFDERILRRNLAMELFDAIYQRLFPAVRENTPTENALIDIWGTIRHQLWLDREEPKPHGTVDSSPPLLRSELPPVEVRKVE
jgi:hypothetical protein